MGHWCGAVVYNDGNGCGGVAQRFSITRTRITCSFWNVCVWGGEREGICNVMVKGGRCIKIFSIVYIRVRCSLRMSYFLIGRSGWRERCATARKVCDGKKAKNHATAANF